MIRDNFILYTLSIWIAEFYNVQSTGLHKMKKFANLEATVGYGGGGDSPTKTSKYSKNIDEKKKLADKT